MMPLNARVMNKNHPDGQAGDRAGQLRGWDDAGKCPAGMCAGGQQRCASRPARPA